MGDLPNPLTPPDVHGRDLGLMPFDDESLGDRYTWLLLPVLGQAVVVNMMLSAWHRRPIASLPSSALRPQKGGFWFGARVSRKFVQDHSEAILKPWVLCSDGRAYHVWLAEQANRIRSRKRAVGRRWEEIRTSVFERDGYQCHYCGAESERMQVDHIHPVIRGGADDIDNLVACCPDCNIKKGSRVLGVVQ